MFNVRRLMLDLGLGSYPLNSGRLTVPLGFGLWTLGFVLVSVVSVSEHRITWFAITVFTNVKRRPSNLERQTSNAVLFPDSCLLTPVLSPEQIDQHRQDDTQYDRRSDGEIEGEVLLFYEDVAW